MVLPGEVAGLTIDRHLPSAATVRQFALDGASHDAVGPFARDLFSAWLVVVLGLLHHP